MTDGSLRRAARAHAASGWAVLPCSPQTKAPLTAHGHLDATRGPDIINEWWDRWPGAIIGVAIPERVVVLDVDPRNGGSLPALTAALGPLPDTLKVTSGRGDGGQHLYYTRPAVALRGHLPGVPGVDVKKSGYMIAPPSPHPDSGKPYVANGPFRPAALPDLPVSAVTALTVPPARRASLSGPRVLTRRRLEGLVHTVSSATAGDRNNRLHWAACRIFEYADPTTDVNSCLDAIAEAANRGGLSWREIEATVQSARKGAGL